MGHRPLLFKLNGLGDLLPWRFVPRHPRLAIVSNVISTGCLFWIIGSIGLRRARFSVFRRYPRPALTGWDVAFQAEDGLRLAASFWRARDDAPGLVMVHGMGTCRRAVAQNAAWFAAAGYAVLALDMRGHGQSDSALHSFGWRESLDVHAAFNWLKQRQAGAPVAVLGISMGGAATLVGCRGPVPADAMVLQAVFTSMRTSLRSRMALVVGRPVAMLVEPFLSLQTRLRFGVWPSAISPLAAITRATCPILFIGGLDDGYVPPAQTLALHAAARGPRQLWLVAAWGHKEVADTTAPEYRQRVLQFLDEAIGERRDARNSTIRVASYTGASRQVPASKA